MLPIDKELLLVFVMSLSVADEIVDEDDEERDDGEDEDDGDDDEAIDEVVSDERNLDNCSFMVISELVDGICGD
jgi:hypothetical protein